MKSVDPNHEALQEYLHNQHKERLIRSHYDDVTEANNKQALLDLSAALSPSMFDSYREDTPVEEGDMEMESFSCKFITDLMSNFVIWKRGIADRITEAEFYYFAPDHLDIITYPRRMNGGRWFFHQSGVDLTFDSYLAYTDCGLIDAQTSSFGGILIRSMLIHTGNGPDKLISGPMKCVYELWDDFDALSPQKNEYPHLLYRPVSGIQIGRSPRHYPIKQGVKSEKFASLLAKYANCPVTESDFDKFLSLRYRFYRTDL